MVKNDSKKTVKIFAAASFLNDFGSDMIYPIWPLFVTTVFGANMAMLGLIDGLGDAVVSLSKAASGYLSDCLGKRKGFIWFGYILGSLSRIGYAFSLTWHYLIPFRILDRSGKIRSAPRDAIIADISTKETRGRNFGLLRAMDNLGAVCGILACIFLINFLGYRKLFLLAAIPSGISALLIVLFTKEKKSGTTIYKGLSLKDLDSNFKLFLLVSSLFALGSFSYSFLLLYAKESGLKITFVPMLYLIFTSVASIVSLPCGRLSDTIGRKSVLMISFIVWAFACACFIVFPTYYGSIFAFVLYGLHKGAMEPAQKAFVAELSPVQYRASTLGGFQLVTGLCAFPASLFAGILWENISMSAPLYVSLVLTTVATILLVFVKEP